MLAMLVGLILKVVDHHINIINPTKEKVNHPIQLTIKQIIQQIHQDGVLDYLITLKLIYIQYIKYLSTSMGQQDKQLIEQRVTYQSKLKISLIIWNITLSSFYFGYCIVYLGQIQTETLKSVFNIDLSIGTTEGLLNGCIPIGALIGALSSSFLIARFSRRNCLLIINCFAFTVGALIYIQYFPTLVFFRLCQGFCVGFFSAIAPLMVKQLAPTEISGTLGSYTQLNVCLGVFTGCIFAYLLKKITGDPSGKDFWYIVFGLPQITIAIQSLVLIFVFPYETPKYLLSIGKEQQARKLIELIYKPEYVDEILEQKKGDLQSSQTKRHVEVDTVLSQQSVSGTSNTTITIVIAIHLAVMQQFSGINGVAIYGGKIAGEATSGQLALLMPSLINFEQVLATFVTSYLLTKFGRKTILLYGALFEGIACGLVMIGFFIKDSSSVGEPLILIGLFMFMAVFGLSLGPVVWLYIPEIVQPKIVPYSTASNWISASLVIILFPIATQDLLDGNPGVLFVFFTVWCLGSFVFNYLFVLETKDKTERMIREEYANKKLCC